MKQLTLQQTIDKIKEIGLIDEEGRDKTVVFDFGYFKPTEVDSWRGDYSHPAIGFTDERDAGVQTLSELLEDLEGAVGKEVTGYKGGEFTLSGDDYLWVDNYGHSSCTGIFDIEDIGYNVIIRTTHFEY